MERGEHPVPGEHPSRSLKPQGERRWGGAIRMELQGSREQNLGQQWKPGARKELRDARWHRRFVRRTQGREPGQQQVLCGAQEGDQQGGTKPWRSSAWLVPSRACRVYSCRDFPGSEGSSAYFCLWPAACWQTWMQMPHPRRAWCVQMARIKVPKAASPRQHTQPVASSAPLPFPAQGGSQAVRAV